MKKRDGRTLDRKTMEVIRRDAVERVRAGEDVSTVMASYRMARTTFYKWTARMEAGDGTLRSLRARKARGRASLLNADHKRAVRRAIVGSDPREHGFDFGLWTRAVVRALILERWGIACSVEAVGKLLRELKLTPQRPLTRAWQQDPKAVAHWRKHRFPALRREAQAAGSELLFLDETGFRADAQMGRTWGARGKTPVVYRDGRRPSVNVIGMVSALEAFYWQVFQGSFHAGRFLEFLRAFMKGRKKPVIIVLDRHPVHPAAAVLREAAGSGGRLRFEYLPTYAPELNLGFDLEVLKGGRKSLSGGLVKLVFVELTYCDLYRNGAEVDEILAFSRESAFRLVSLYDMKYAKGLADLCDGLFLHTAN